MKKKFGLIVALFMSCIFLFSACSFPNAKMSGEIDYNYVVKSNGGSAVQMGNYVYFINGKEETTDEDGKNNVWGDVQKGGIYRAELIGTSSSKVDYSFVNRYKLNQPIEKPEGIVDFKVDAMSDPLKALINLDLYSEKGEDYDENIIDVVTVERLVPKIINNAADRGLFIFDGYMYYTTPSNRKDSAGVIQYTFSDFMRTSLDGKTTHHIATSNSSSFDYYYYHQNGMTYLVVYEDGKLTSYALNSKKRVSTTVLAEDVTSVAFPKQDIWYKNKPTNTLSDFIFFTRAQVGTDKIQSGNTVEIILPDGTHRTHILQTRQNVTINTIADNLLFYQIQSGSHTQLRYTDLANVIFDIFGQPPYEMQAGATLTTIDEIALSSLPEGTIVPRRDSPYFSTVTVFVFNSSGIFSFENGTNQRTILNTGAELVHYDRANNVFYFSKWGDTGIYRPLYHTRSDQTMDQKSGDGYEKAIERNFLNDFFKVDFAGGQMWFVVETIDEWASNYMMVRRVHTNSSEREIFVGEKKEDDLKPEDEDEDEDETGDSTT